MSKLKVAFGLSTGHTTLTTHMCTDSSRIADCAGMENCTLHGYSLYKVEIILPQSPIHYEHNFCTLASDVVCRYRKTFR